ncbi:unnamed protein product [Rangifer tarandus platyrhynchus]|uniref:Uncharacterized protein n=2 Tax=Rangifer tarandus platyrhynchus TaxID=3082113 RepID=A0ABN8YBQ7_RANTA|nr:unnamed protein product [Rangifer tarandus platyrhynchus]CAI9698426.1 unnamed protein product [Rangifer tarandus platyrhynchus]
MVLHYKAVDLHEVSSARRGGLVGEAGVGVAHWARSGRLSQVKVCSSRRKRRPCCLGNRIQSVSQSERRGLRRHRRPVGSAVTRKRSGLCGSEHPSVSMSPADLIPSAAGST